MSVRNGWLVLLAMVGMSAQAQSTPYGGTAVAMPGRIEAEKYDLGGEGVGYHDSDTVNSGGQFRTDGVDLVNCTDTACGQALSDVRTGEWLRYSVSNSATAAYTLNVRVAAAVSGGLFHLEIDNVNVTGSLTVPNTGSLSTWQTVTKNDVVLRSGSHVLKLVAESNGFSVNWLELATAQTAYTPGIRTIPGTLEAEAYDQGGSGVSWSDTTAGNGGAQFRTDDVDIVNCDYSSGGTPRCVQANASGEWLEYTVNVQQAGYYVLSYRNGGGGTVSIDLKIDGVAIAGSNSSQTTPDNFTYTTTTIGKVYLPAGDHVLRMNYSGSGTNPQIDWISFASTQTAYNATPAVIPGKIELENYDVGGDNVSFHDSDTTNSGGVYRTDGVDLKNCTDSGCGSNKWVYAIASGEWLEYTLDVAYTADYAISLRGTPQASGAGPSYGAMTMKFDNSAVMVTCDNTTAGSTPRIIQCGSYGLSAGKHRVRVSAGAVVPTDIDYLNLVPVSAAPTGCGSCSSSIPGKIEAENYDTGGNNIGFSGVIDSVASTDTPASGVVIGAIDDTEWLNYTVNATRPGPYTLQLRVASATGASVQVFVDGAGIGTYSVPNTGSYSTWQTITASNVPMTAGFHVVKIVDASGHFYMNWLQFDPTLANDVAPTVSMTAPANNASFAAGGNITLSATAADSDGTISKVEFYNGATLLGTVNSSPYNYSWTGASPGSYTLTAKAYDNAGMTTSSTPVAITVNTPPTVSITAPAANAVFTSPATIPVTVAASDADGSIAKVELYMDGSLISTATSVPYSFSVGTAILGSHTLTAKAYDNLNAATTSAGVAITVNMPPTVTLTAPANNAQFTPPASITLSATASDSDGTIAKVDFYNGATLLGTVATPPYSYTWTNVAKGAYTLTAKATDNRNAVTTSAAVNIVVNRAPTVSITAPAASAVYAAPASITVNASAADSDGTISKVEFYNNGTLLPSATVTTGNAGVYSYTWSGVAAGSSYSLTAKATDDLGAATTSAAVPVVVDTPPAVSITAPVSPNNVFGAPATVTVTATASDSDDSVSKVEFFNGGTLVGTATALPYSATLSNLAIGSYSITAKATDTRGLSTTSAAVTISVVNNQAPVVWINSPIAPDNTFASPGSIVLSASAGDSDGSISKVEFFSNGALIPGGSVSTNSNGLYSFPWNNVGAGTYSVTAVAYDNLSTTTTSVPVQVSVVSGQAPQVSIISPVAPDTSFYTGRAIPLVASVTDADGSVGRVDFFANGGLIGSVDGSSGTATFKWSMASEGTYSITAKAYDSTKLSATSAATSITVTSPPALVAGQPLSAALTSTVSDGYRQGNGGVLLAPARIVLTATALSSQTGSKHFKIIKDGAVFDEGNVYGATYVVGSGDLTAGDYVFTAQVTDAASGEVATSAPLAIHVVNDKLPQVTLTTPSAGAIGSAPASLHLTATASDADSNGSISKVEYFRNGGVSLGSATASPYVVDLGGVGPGSYRLTARAYDNLGFWTDSEPVMVMVSPSTNAPPSVDWVLPVSTTQSINGSFLHGLVSASDSDGTIDHVEFYDGDTLLGSASVAPYEFTYDGKRTYNDLYARAYDNQGAFTETPFRKISVGDDYKMRVTTPADNSVLKTAETIVVSGEFFGTYVPVLYFGTMSLREGSQEYCRQSSYARLNNPSISWRCTVALTSGTHVLHAIRQSNSIDQYTVEAVRRVTVDLVPTVTITFPTEGYVVHPGASLTLAANASVPSHVGNVEKVEFRDAGALMPNCTDTTRPFNCVTPPLSSGTHQFTATAYLDSTGSTGTSSAVSVYGRNTPPTVSITSPQSNESVPASSSIRLEANAQDVDGTISKIEFFEGTTLLCTALPSMSPPAPATFCLWSGATSGPHTITAKATDDDASPPGISVSAEVRFTVTGNALPSVAFASPNAGDQFSAHGNIVFSANASDSDGTISKVEFFNGSTQIGVTRTAPPYSVTWQDVPAGTYTITAKATDNLGGVGTANRVITVQQSTGPQVWIVTPTNNAVYSTQNGSASIVLTAATTGGAGSSSVTYVKRTYSNDPNHPNDFTEQNLTTIAGAGAGSTYAFTWTTSPDDVGKFGLVAKATDSAQVTVSSPEVVVRLVKASSFKSLRAATYDWKTDVSPYPTLATACSQDPATLNFNSPLLTRFGSSVNGVSARPDAAGEPVAGQFDIAPGRWWDASRAGQGFDLLWYAPMNDRDDGRQNLFVLWYTYRNEAPRNSATPIWKPVWYAVVGNWTYDQTTGARLGWMGDILQIDQTKLGAAGHFDPQALRLDDHAKVGEMRVAVTTRLPQGTLGSSPNFVAIQWAMDQDNPTDPSDLQPRITHSYATQCIRNVGESNNVPPSSFPDLSGYSGTWHGEATGGWIFAEYIYKSLEQSLFLSYEKTTLGGREQVIPRWAISERSIGTGNNNGTYATCDLLPYVGSSAPYQGPKIDKSQFCVWESSGYSPAYTSTNWLPGSNLRQIGRMERTFDSDPSKSSTIRFWTEGADEAGSWLAKVQPAMQIPSDSAPGTYLPVFMRKELGKHSIIAFPVVYGPPIDGFASNEAPRVTCVVPNEPTDASDVGLCDVNIHWQTDGNFPHAAVFARRGNAEPYERSLLQSDLPYSPFQPPYHRHFIGVGEVPEGASGQFNGESYTFELWSDTSRSELLATSGTITATTNLGLCYEDRAPVTLTTNPAASDPVTGARYLAGSILDGKTDVDPIYASVSFTSAGRNFRIRLYDVTNAAKPQLLWDSFSTSRTVPISSAYLRDASRNLRVQVDSLSCKGIQSAIANFKVALMEVPDQTMVTPAYEKSDGTGESGSLYPTTPVMLMDGTAGVSGGAATYDLPIRLPPGRHGMAPSVSLSYSSRSGPGIAGLGWSLSGQSSIHRCAKVPAIDNTIGGVKFDASDKLCLDGQRLIAFEGTYGQPGAKYKTELDSYTRVTQIGGSLDPASTNTWFKVELKSGEIRYYGRNKPTQSGAVPNSRITPVPAAESSAIAAPLSWAMDTRLDRFGNTVDFAFHDFGKGEFQLEEIRYSGRTEGGSIDDTSVVASGDRVVRFNYTAAGLGNTHSSYLSQRYTVQTQKLTSIDVKLGSTLVRTYQLNPGFDSGQSGYSGRLLLHAVRQCEGGNRCLPDTEFNYAGDTSPPTRPTWAFHQREFYNSTAGPYSKDGFIGLNIVGAPSSPAGAGLDSTLAGRGGDALRPSIPTLAASPADANQYVVWDRPIGDIDGDGTSEFYQVRKQVGTPAGTGYFQYLVSYTADRRLKNTIEVNESTQGVAYVMGDENKGDVNNDGRADFVSVLFKTKTPTDTDAVVVISSLKPGKVLNEQTTSADIDIVETPVHTWTGFQESDVKYMYLSATLPRLVDMNGDGRADIVLERNRTRDEWGRHGWTGPQDHCMRAVFIHLNYGHGAAITRDDFRAAPDESFCISQDNGPDHMDKWTFGELQQITDIDGDGIPDIMLADAVKDLNAPMTDFYFGSLSGGGGGSLAQWHASDRVKMGSIADDLKLYEFASVADHHEWIDVNGDGLMDSLALNCADPSTIRLNLGGRKFSRGIQLSNDSSTLPAGMVACKSVSREHAQFTSRVDVDSDGRPDFLVPRSFAARICRTLQMTTKDGRPPDGEGTNALAIDPMLDVFSPDPLRRSGAVQVGTTTEQVYACPESLDTTAGSNPDFASKYLHGQKVVRMYLNDFGSFDDSLYNMGVVRLLEISPGSFKFYEAPSSTVPSIIMHPANNQTGDYFGDGMDDILVSSICADDFASTTPDTPACLPMTTIIWDPATPGGTPPPPVVYGPSQLPDGTAVGTPGAFINENRGADGPSYNPKSAPQLPELMTFAQKRGNGDVNVDSMWQFAPLSSSAGRGSTELPLYAVPYRDSGTGYVDDSHFYFASSMPVVASFWQSNGVTARTMNQRTFSYEEAMYNNRGRGFMGFRKIIEDDLATHVRTTTRFLQKWPFVGLAECQATSLIVAGTKSDQCLGSTPESAGTYLSLMSASWISSPPMSALPPPGSIIDVRPSGSISYTRDADGVTPLRRIAINTIQDAFGNTTVSETIDADLAGAADPTTGKPWVRYRKVVNDFRTDSNNWWLTKLVATTTGTDRIPQGSSGPTYVGVSKRIEWNDSDPSSSILRVPSCEAAFEGYRPDLSLPNCVSAGPSDATWVRTDSTTSYDPWGNPTGSTVTARDPLNTVSGKVTRSTSGSFICPLDAMNCTDGYFPTTATTAAGTQKVRTTTSSTDRATGAVTSVRAPNGLTVVSEVDSFGRPLVTHAPETASHVRAGPDAHIAYQWCTDESGRCAGVPNALYRVVHESAGSPKSITWFDQLGREIRTETEAFAANETVVTTRQFNDRGLLQAEAGPYSSLASPENTGRGYDYDILGRMVFKWAETPKSDKFDGSGTRYLTTIYKIEGTTTRITVCGRDTPTRGNAETDGCVADYGKILTLMSRSYDGSGKLLRTVDANGNAMTYSYDAQGNGTGITDVLNRTVSATYNRIGQRVSSSDPNRGDWSYVYDGLGELRRQEDARHVVSTFAYDELGRKTSRSWNEPQDRDPLTGQLVGATDYTDRWDWDTDFVGSLGGQTRYRVSTPIVSSTMQHDAFGRVYSTTDTIQPLQLGANTPPMTYTTSTDYDSGYGRVKSVTYPGLVRSYLTYDKRGFLKETGLVGGFVKHDDPSNVFVSRTVSMDAKGRVTEALLGNGLTEKQRYETGLGQLLETCVQATATDPTACNDASWGGAYGTSNKLGDYAYRYDVYGNALEQRSLGVQDPNANLLQYEVFDYDVLHRLKSATRYSGAGPAGNGGRSDGIAVNYDYDALGNLKSKSDFSQAAPTAYHYANPDHPYAVSSVDLAQAMLLAPTTIGAVTYGYDANGNMVSSSAPNSTLTDTAIEYNSDNQPSRISSSSIADDKFRYTADGAKVYQRQSTNTAVNHIFTVGGLEETFVGDFVGTANTLNSVRRYSLPGGALYVVRALPPSTNDLPAGMYYRHSDRLGSAVFTTNDAGVVVERRGFDAFGKARDPNWGTTINGGKLASIVDRHGFTGHEHLDNVQLIHMNGRLYDYNLGRFLGVDPLIQFPKNSQSFGSYNYLMNNPMAGTDPTGYGCAASQISSVCDKEASGGYLPIAFGHVANFRNGSEKEGQRSEDSRIVFEQGAPESLYGLGSASNPTVLEKVTVRVTQADLDRAEQERREQMQAHWAERQAFEQAYQAWLKHDNDIAYLFFVKLPATGAACASVILCSAISAHGARENWDKGNKKTAYALGAASVLGPWAKIYAEASEAVQVANLARSAEVGMNDVNDLQRLASIRNSLGSEFDSGSNIAFAEVNVDGASYSMAANSGRTLGSTTPQVENLHYEYIVVRHPRMYDSEAKILENIRLQVSTESVGTVRIFSRIEICANCSGVGNQFRAEHPGIDLEMTSARWRPIERPGLRE